MVVVAFAALVLVSSPASGAVLSHTWTSDTDFSGAGAGGTNPVFLSTEVVGTGTPAEVDLIKSVTDWVNKNPSAPTPGTLEGPSIAFDTMNHVTVLFGGYTAGSPSYSNRTWEYNYTSNTWTEVTSTPKPDAREGGGMSYDPGQNVIVLYGGFDAAGQRTDTWKFNVQTQTWASVTPTGTPPPMADTPLTYDSTQGKHILMGMSLVTGQMETWAYDAGANSWTNRQPSGLPSPRSGGGVAYDPDLDRTVLFGGAFLTTLYADTFEYSYSSNSWSQVSAPGPSARASFMMTFKPGTAATAGALFFGGQTQTGKANDAWRYSSSHAWSLVGTNTHPPARTYDALTYDTANDVAILYGGTDSGSNLLGDTWSLGASYAAAGKYTTAVFDSGGFADWGELWWNLTTQPPQTFLRFQIATSNDPLTGWSAFHGPSPACSSTSYFTTSGTPIGACTSPPQDDGKRYIKILADFGNLDQATPSLTDLTITYSIPPAPPCLVSTDPPNLTFNVPFYQNVTITFSKPMNPSSILINITRGYVGPGGFTRSWNTDNSILTLLHPAWLLGENQVYQYSVWGTDTDGKGLSPTCPDGSQGAPNPVTFVTTKVYPWITKITPPLGYIGYNVSRPLYVEFSEGMNTSNLVATLTPSITGGFSPVWTNQDKNVTLNHGTPLAFCTRYTLAINATDKANLQLVLGPVPNPTYFYSECPWPYITSESPFDQQLDVPLTAPIVIGFSKPMLRSSVVVTFDPLVGGRTDTWSDLDHTLTIAHTQSFPTCQVYKVTVVGTDTGGVSLVPNPIDPTVVNPWKFMALCDNPSIIHTIPADGATNVSVTQDFQVFFSDAMDTATVQYRVTGGPYTETSVQWNPPANIFMTISHLPLQECTRYTINVYAGSAGGRNLVPGLVPNPWSFDTVCNSPYITSENPANNTALVPLGYEIWANFTKPMDPMNTIYILTPNSPTLTMNWLNGDRTLRLSHPGAPFTDCTVYTIYVDGNSADGYPLITGYITPSGLPDPWTFSTYCVTTFPYITNEAPADQQQGVALAASIVVDFSEAMNPGTFMITSSPTVTWDLPPTWSLGNTRVTVTHASSPFQDCRQYTVTISAHDQGNGLDIGNITGSKPDPWTFKALCVPPQITDTNPVDGATNILGTLPVWVNFTEPMLRSSVSAAFNPTIGGISYTWLNGDRMLRVDHSALNPSTQYCVRIAGTDLDSMALVPGPVPNPWCFTTSAGAGAPRGLQVARSPPTDVILTWQPLAGATQYAIYHAISKTTSWPWTLLATVTTTSYVHAGALNDGLSHFYIVRGRFGGSAESLNSTMGFLVPLSFTYNNGRSNVYWLSLPYRSIYHRASDISDELTSARIDTVAKWDPATQRLLLWIWFRNGWRGTNFPLGPGDGFYIGARASFQWAINGTDGSVAHTFTYYPSQGSAGNLNWISLPYTSTYTTASAVVLSIEGSLGGNANTKIIEVAKWDALTQTLAVFRWQTGGWAGNNFSIAPGEGIYLKIVSTFTWTPQLITPEVP